MLLKHDPQRMERLLMAAIVATLLYLPVWGIASTLAFARLDIPYRAFFTFGDSVGRVTGVLALWLIGFLLAVPYVARAVPFASGSTSSRAIIPSSPGAAGG